MRAPLLLLLAACRGYLNADPTGDAPVPDDGVGLIGDSLTNPWPSALLIDDGGLSLTPELFPPSGPTPLRTERLDGRRGFSPAQTAVVRGLDVDPAGFPGVDTPAGEGTVRIVDLTTGTWVPTLAELDAWPGAEPPSLLIRPLQALPDGHRIAVVITTAATPRPERFDHLMRGTPPASLAAYQPTHDALLRRLDELGVRADDVALAWDFPVEAATRPLRSALEQLTVPTAAALDVHATPATPQAWRTATGTVSTTGFLVDDLALELLPGGDVAVVGTSDAHVFVHVPLSVADAPAGSVPVLFFGHGIFASPEFYLDDPSDSNGVLALADELGAIVVATNWRGLTTPDLVDTTLAAGDFARIHEVTDRLVQAHVNLRSLIAMVEAGHLLDHPGLAGRDGQVLFDPDRRYYYGISLGGIEGAVLWATDAPVDAAALHVGGAMWSTMLERSSNWPLFEGILVRVVDDPADRQLLYSLSQLYWDPVDPMSYTADLQRPERRPALLQIAIGDEQVPNFTSDALARSVGLPLLAPEVGVPEGLSSAAGPLTRAYVQFDPGTDLPPATNRPAPVTDAHTTPRTWPGARHQVVRFLRDGVIEHFCGDAPCTASNPGTP